MHIYRVSNYSMKAKTSANNKVEETIGENNKQNTFLDKFETNIRNSADLNDTIKVPRTIFKGYLAFMAGTALTTIAAIAQKKHPKISNTFNAISAGLIIYGTYSFVRPYIIKDK